MAATKWIEMETGTGCRTQHPHNGYWAGDFSARPPERDELEESATRALEHAGRGAAASVHE
jgi:hypothetical protein